MESQEFTAQNIERTGAAVESILKTINNESERMDDFAIRNLNPFPDTQALERFAETSELGRGIVLEFWRPVNFGEEIQGQFISQFFEKYFPNADIVRLNDNNDSSRAKNVIKLDMLDYDEERNGVLNSGKIYKDPASRFKGLTLFSMIQTKLIHNIRVPDSHVGELKEKIFQEIQKQSKSDVVKDVPLVVGEVMPEKFSQDMKESFRYIYSAGSISPYFFNSETGKIAPEAFIPIKGKQLRFLYSLGDFSAIKYNRNKLEGVSNNARVITLDDEYLDPKQNSNYNLDKLLHERGLVKSKKDILESGGLRSNILHTPFSDSDKQEVYNALIDPKQKNIYEPTLKQSMVRVFDRIRKIKKIY